VVVVVVVAEEEGDLSSGPERGLVRGSAVMTE